MTNGPTFIGMGMQKSGTRWLYEQLRAHPDFWMPPLKEFHFWGSMFPRAKFMEHLRRKAPADEADRRFRELYLSLPQRRDHPVSTYRQLFSFAGGKLTGEITPDYSGLPPEAVGRIARSLPGLKAVMMVRDPVQRAWSALNDAVNEGKMDGDAVRTPAALLAAVRRMEAISRPARTYRLWSEHLPTGYFLLDDVTERPEETRQAILRFLGAPTDRLPAIGASHNSKAGRARAPFTPELREALAGFFADELRASAAAFGGAAERWPGRYGLG